MNSDDQAKGCEWCIVGGASWCVGVVRGNMQMRSLKGRHLSYRVIACRSRSAAPDEELPVVCWAMVFCWRVEGAVPTLSVERVGTTLLDLLRRWWRGRMVLVELSEARETSPGRCWRASTAEPLVGGGILVVSRRLRRDGLLEYVSLVGDVESELSAGSAVGREVIIIPWVLACCSERP
ncbi:Serine/threonine-protein kinase [Alternaria alternata]|jgi:hypothetical protein|nr:Serine/threonine-protein kinase [Alternaria alternata]